MSIRLYEELRSQEFQSFPLDRVYRPLSTWNIKDSNGKKHTGFSFYVISLLRFGHAPRSPQPRRSLRTTKQPVSDRPATRVLLESETLSRLSSLRPYRPKSQQRDHPALEHLQRSACP